MNKDSPASLATGIALTVAAAFLLATLDALGKEMMATLSVIQVLWARYVVHTALATGYLAGTSGTRFLRTRRPVLQVLRALSLFAASLLVYFALANIPLADVTAIVFFSPVIVTILSSVVLKERIGKHRIGAVLVGLAGVMLVIEPGFGTTGPYHLLVLGAAGLNALYLMFTRQLAGADEAPATQFHTTALASVVLSAMVVGDWRMPTGEDVLFLVLLGILAALGHFALLRAFAHAPASLLSPYLYSQVLFATFYSVVWFGHTPRLTMVAGTILLVGSGLYIWWRERRRHAAAA